MKFNEFVNKMKAQGGIDKDGAYGKQCMDLYNYYCIQVLGLQDGKTGASCAKQILNNSYVLQNVTRINNTPSFVPQKGDIAVWTGGTYGHVAICLGVGDVNTFRSLEQNWQAQKLTEENHNYTYLAPLVFLRPKNQKNIIENVSQGNYKTLEVMKVRDGVWGRQKGYNELTEDGKKNALPNGCYKKGTVFTVLEIINHNDGSVWARGYSGYVCIKDKNNIYCVKI